MAMFNTTTLQMVHTIVNIILCMCALSTYICCSVWCGIVIRDYDLSILLKDKITPPKSEKTRYLLTILASYTPIVNLVLFLMLYKKIDALENHPTGEALLRYGKTEDIVFMLSQKFRINPDDLWDFLGDEKEYEIEVKTERLDKTGEVVWEPQTVRVPSIKSAFKVIEALSNLLESEGREIFPYKWSVPSKEVPGDKFIFSFSLTEKGKQKEEKKSDSITLKKERG